MDTKMIKTIGGHRVCATLAAQPDEGTNRLLGTNAQLMAKSAHECLVLMLRFRPYDDTYRASWSDEIMPNETRRSVLRKLSAGLSLAAASPILATLSPEQDAAPISRTAEAAPALPDRQIVQAIIYPAIGIGRVGSSDEYFHGPEVTDPEPLREGAYRDRDKRLKRQAARFRVYGCNARGDIVRELTTEGSGAEIEWHVQLANTKSAWFGFQLALDIPEASHAVPTTLRNPGITDRHRLAITPSAKTLHGGNAGPVAFDDGAFMDLPVYLGEARTDADQRLTVLGGRGRARSHDDSAAVTFANNEGWHDDVSDGPVTATVRLHGVHSRSFPRGS
jgi:hypothetical protein